MNKVLIVIDMQNDFINGSLSNPDAEKIIPFIEKEILSNKYDEVIFTQDTHISDYLNTQEGQNLPIEHCIYGTHGWQIVDSLNKYVKDNTICKTTFGYTNWLNEYFHFKNVKEIVVVGTCTDICVISNVLILKATYPEIKITVLSQGCAGLTIEKHNAALEVMKSCQVNVID